MAFLLDTNVVSELRRPRPHEGVLAWIQSIDDAELYLASVTIGKIQAGIELTRDQDSLQKPMRSSAGSIRCATPSTSSPWMALHSAAGLS